MKKDYNSLVVFIVTYLVFLTILLISFKDLGAAKCSGIAVILSIFSTSLNDIEQAIRELKNKDKEDEDED